MKHYVLEQFITYQIIPRKEQISDDLSHRFQVSAVHWLAHYCNCILYVIVLLLTFVDNNHLLGSEFAFAALLESFALQLLAALGMDNATDLASLSSILCGTLLCIFFGLLFSTNVRLESFWNATDWLAPFLIFNLPRNIVLMWQCSSFCSLPKKGSNAHSFAFFF